MKITKNHLRRIIQEETDRLIKETRQFKPLQREGSVTLNMEDGAFSLALELPGSKDGALFSAIVEGNLDEDSVNMLEKLT